jgi:hypothetical protein
MDGKISWFDSARGYGFIEPGDGGDDILFAAPDADFDASPVAGCVSGSSAARSARGRSM